ncbi:MAG: class I SAM-dependent methyltransferase, partial [Acidobacteria bacterium]|nr:class I SAM-dependent methyltransferase [Acidobacteriota bacterium]
MMSRSRLSLFHNGLFLLVSTLTLLGGAVGFQQTKRAPATTSPPAATKPAPAPSSAAPAAADKIARPTSEPYKGSLSIFEDPEREEKLQINRVMDVLRIKEGSRVADIGAGSGWFTVRAARRV